MKRFIGKVDEITGRVFAICENANGTLVQVPHIKALTSDLVFQSYDVDNINMTSLKQKDLKLLTEQEVMCFCAGVSVTTRQPIPTPEELRTIH